MRNMFMLVGLVVPAAVSAATFDFTALGANNTLLANTVVQNGVTAYGYQTNLTTAANLWLRNQTNDHGLGVCATAEAASCATGGGDVNELDNAGTLEFIVLQRPNGTFWTQLWVSSLDGGGTGGSEEGRLVWGNSIAELTAGTNFFDFLYVGGSVEKEILGGAGSFDPNALYVMFTHAPGVGTNNDYLVWRGAYERSGQLVPEPGTLVLLSVAALSLLASRRRKAH